MSTIKNYVAAAVVVGLLVPATFAIVQSWRLAGSALVTRKIHNRYMTVNKNGKDVRRIRLRALNVAIKVWDMTIYFENGETQKVKNLKIIGKNRDSAEIDLNGGKRKIKRIIVRANAVSFTKKRAVLWLYAHR